MSSPSVSYVVVFVLRLLIPSFCVCVCVLLMVFFVVCVCCFFTGTFSTSLFCTVGVEAFVVCASVVCLLSFIYYLSLL
jgi:hypothetical protein